MKSVAIIIPGGIGTGKDNIGVPVLNGLVKLIAAQCHLTVFSLAKVNPDYKPVGFELIDVHRSNAFIRSLVFPFVFRKLHRQQKFTAVHGFWAMPAGLLAMIVGKLFGVKSIVSVLGGDAAALPEIGYGRLHKPLMRWLILMTLRKADHINALTKYLANNLASYGFKREIEIIPWGVDKEMFDYHPRPQRGVITFLHVANLHPVKDQETLLRAFALINRALSSKLIMVGSGVDRQKVDGLINELDLKHSVKLIQPVAYEQLPGIYHDADILLHTSLSEGQCEVVTEAMSCGLPVCGTKVGLMYDLPDCCATVNVRDHVRLAEEVLKLISDAERMNEIRMRAHQWTSHHDILWTAGKLIAIYRS